MDRSGPPRKPSKPDTELEPCKLRVRFRPEPAYSLFGRLAARNGATSCRQFAKDLGLRYFGEILGGGRTDAVRIIAGLPGADVAANTVVMSPGRASLGGESFIGRLWAPKQRRYCPQCLKGDFRGSKEEDGPRPFRPYRRAWWDVTLVENCPVHSCELHRTCPACQSPLGVDDPWPWRCRCEADLTTARRIARSPDDCLMDRYLVGRLGGCPRLRVPVLDGMPLDVAASAAYYVGEIAFRGRGGDPGRSHRHPASEIGREGLRILSDWPHGFTAVLDDMVRDIPMRDRENLSTRLAYGALSMWLARAPETSLDPMRAAIHDHAERTRASVPRLPTIRAAAAGLRIAGPRFFALALKEGLIPRGTTYSLGIRVDEETIGVVRDVLDEAMGQKAAAALMAISVPVFDRLVGAGLVETCEAPVEHRGSAYSRRGLLALMERLSANAPIVDAPGSGRLPLPMASFRGRVELPRLIEALLDGRIQPVGRMPHKRGLQAILVNLPDVVAFHQPPPNSMLMEEAAEIFGVNYFGFSKLMRSGLVEGRRFLGRTNKRWWIDNEALKEFVQEFGTVRHLADRHKISRNVARLVLEECAVEPVLNQDVCPIQVYRYSQVDHLIRNSDLTKAYKRTRWGRARN